jgi:hypothetical protein
MVESIGLPTSGGQGRLVAALYKFSAGLGPCSAEVADGQRHLAPGDSETRLQCGVIRTHSPRPDGPFAG